MQLTEQSLAEIACNIAGATRIFHNYGMDFCCGGKRSLREEATRKNKDLAEITAALQNLATTKSAMKDWRESSTEELLNHIVERFHLRHREQLPEVIRLAAKVEKVHGDHPDVPKGLASHLENMQTELLEHMIKEESILFPMLAREDGYMAGGPIAVMEMEHMQHGAALEKMLELAHNLIPPEGACNSWRALYLGLSELRNDLMEHIHLENNILFKKTAYSEGKCCGSCS